MKFERERTRAARDLLAEVRIDKAETVFDLGCGPGNSVELLQQRFSEAQVIGLDTSESMLAHAQRRAPKAIFRKQDIETWLPGSPVDLIFANAALHFLPHHESLFPRLVSFLRSGGCFAVQMPNIVHEASHAAMRLVAADGPWASRLAPIAQTRPVIASFEQYDDWLRPHSSTVQFWMTTYVHPVSGPGDIVDWFAGSGLRPFLDALNEAEQQDFLRRYRRELDYAYPTTSTGKTFLTYPRLFIVAVKS